MDRSSALEADPAGEGQPASVPPAATARPARFVPPASNPTFGVDYLVLGLLAASPALFAAAGLLLSEVRLPLVPRVSFGLVLGVLIVGLSLATLVVHFLRFPAWSQPGVTLLPVCGLFLPASVLHGQVAARVNGDPARILAVPFAITWALLAAAVVVSVAVTFLVGQYAPSFSGSALLPLPLLLAWVIVLLPSYSEPRVIRAVASSLALTSCMIVFAWVAPARWRAYVPLVAIGAQLGLFWWLRLGWPRVSGVIGPLVWLDIALYVMLVVLVGVAPLGAVWTRRAGWPALRRQLGYGD